MTKLIINPNIISTKSKDGNSILICDLDDDKDTILRLKDVSIDFYNLIEKGYHKDNIIDEIANIYSGCSKEEVKKDLEDFIKNLKKLNILS